MVCLIIYILKCIILKNKLVVRLQNIYISSHKTFIITPMDSGEDIAIFITKQQTKTLNVK